jgi:Domain of unknown function (DUF4926)
MIEELDRVALTRNLPEHGLIAGDIGAVVGVHQEGRGYTLEFMSLDGNTIAIVTLDAKDVRTIGAREIAHARAVA